MIIWLASFPRSGNTFARIVQYHKYGIHTYSVYDDPLFRELGAENTVGHKPLPASLDKMNAGEKRYIVKTHDLPTDDNPAIYLVRDGRDAVVSMARYRHAFPKKRGLLSRLRGRSSHDSFQDTLEEVIRDDNYVGGWSGNVLAWSHRPKGLTHILKFEDLIEHPDRCLDEALIAVGMDIQSGIDKPPPTFDELHARWPQFFRAGKGGSWRGNAGAFASAVLGKARQGNE